MAVNRYIGARYVPKVMGEWSSEQSYEPLSIVISAGNSYTSKIAVPAGTPLSNSKYWALTGAFSQQVAALQDSVNRLDTLLTETVVDIDKWVSSEGVELRECTVTSNGLFLYINGNCTLTPARGVKVIATTTGNPFKIPKKSAFFPINPILQVKSSKEVVTNSALQVTFDGTNTVLNFISPNVYGESTLHFQKTISRSDIRGV